MFQTKKRKLEDNLSKQTKIIKNIITFDKTRYMYLVEWDDMTRTWEEYIPTEVLIQYRERVLSYIS